MSTPIPPDPPVWPPDPTSLAPGNYTSTVILNRIFKLILEMISSLQDVAAAQADRLRFMSEWQKSYTDAMSQIKTFAFFDGTAFASSGSGGIRDDLNRVNSTYLQTLQNRQSGVSDDAKALQSNVNQSNDAVNQQSNLGTAILSQLSTLLGAIFK